MSAPARTVQAALTHLQQAAARETPAEVVTELLPGLAFFAGVLVLAALFGLWIDHLLSTEGSSNAYLGRRRRRPAEVHGAVIGWKLATVGLGADGRLRFAGLSFSDPYDADADASCSRAHHPAPQHRCTCGFHAYRDRADAEAHAGESFALLRVALSGQFVEYDAGWRTGHQRVEAVSLRESCCCGAPGVGFVLTEPAPLSAELGRVPRLRCRSCLHALVRAWAGPSDILSLEELQDALRRSLPPGRPAEIIIPATALSTAEIEVIRSWQPPLTTLAQHLGERARSRVQSLAARAGWRLERLERAE